MRHATVYAIEEVMSGRRLRFEQTRVVVMPEGNTAWNHASALSDAGFTSGHFNDDRAIELMKGERVDLPTCPTCALLLDEALRLAGLTGGENVEATVSP